MTSKCVIAKMKNLFARFGIPTQVRNDNGGCYNSEAFTSFSLDYRFTHNISGPRYPESNGMAERVQTVQTNSKAFLGKVLGS